MYVEQHMVTKKLVVLQVIKIARVKIKFPSDNKIQSFSHCLQLLNSMKIQVFQSCGHPVSE